MLLIGVHNPRDHIVGETSNHLTFFRSYDNNTYIYSLLWFDFYLCNYCRYRYSQLHIARFCFPTLHEKTGKFPCSERIMILWHVSPKRLASSTCGWYSCQSMHYMLQAIDKCVDYTWQQSKKTNKDQIYIYMRVCVCRGGCLKSA